jgi:hypothetical protein
MKYHSISLFSGIGGNDRALESVATPALYCEINADSRRILQSAMLKGAIGTAPVHDDVRTLLLSAVYKAAKQLIGPKLIVSSWPCQGNSRMVCCALYLGLSLALLPRRLLLIAPHRSRRRASEKAWMMPDQASYATFVPWC